MALSDWNIYKSNASFTWTVDTVSPIRAGGSYKLTDGGVEGAGGSMCGVPRNPPYPHGTTRGRFKALFKAAVTSTTGTRQTGLLTMMSQEDLTGGAGSAYAVFANHDLVSPGLGVDVIGLRKMTAGIGVPTAIATTSVSYQNSTIFGMEVEWLLDIAELGGIEIWCRHGNEAAYDADTMTEWYHNIITSSPLTTNVGPGLYWYMSTTNGTAHDSYIDQINFFAEP